MSRRAITLSLLALAVLVPADSTAVGTGPVGRLTQPAGMLGCIHEGSAHGCRSGSALRSPQDIAISPDGRHAYVASYGSHAVAVFARNRSGELRQLPGRRGCLKHHGVRRCTPARALARPSSITVSPDGRNVYVTAAGSNALAVFARHRRSGALRQLPGARGCLSQLPGGGCRDGRALNEPVAVAVSPDGGDVYVAGRRFPSAIAILKRRRDGSLAQAAGEAGCISQGGVSGCAPARALRSPEDVVVSPDGRTVFVAGMRSNAVAVLRKSPGGLSQADGTAGCLAADGAAGCARGKALSGPVELALTPSGRGLYVASSISDAVASLRVDRTTGALSQAGGRAGCIRDIAGRRRPDTRCMPGRALDEVWGIAVSPDGRNVYTASARAYALGIDARDRATGALRPLPGRDACFTRGGRFGCREGRALTIGVAVAVSPDGRSVYVASEDAHVGAVGIFRRRLR